MHVAIFRARELVRSVPFFRPHQRLGEAGKSPGLLFWMADGARSAGVWLKFQGTTAGEASQYPYRLHVPCRPVGHSRGD
jgi:hypothetical protein